MIPAPKPGGRPREIDIWEVLNAIFYVLCEGIRWRALPGDNPDVADSLHLFPQLAKRWDMGENSRSTPGVDESEQRPGAESIGSSGGQPKCEKCSDGQSSRLTFYTCLFRDSFLGFYKPDHLCFCSFY